MTSEVAICNMALSMLDVSANIASLDDNTKAARLCKLHYAPVRDEVTEEYSWTCARQRVQLAADTVAPAFGWRYQYSLPIDCIRPLQPLYQGQFNGAEIRYEIEDGKLLCDMPGPLPLIYLQRLENPARMSPLMIRAIAAKLASYIGRSISGKQAYVQQCEKWYQEALIRARAIDASQTLAKDPIQDEVTGIR